MWYICTTTTTIIMKKVGSIIKEKRIERELTLRKFCEKANLDPSNWSKIERGMLECPKSEKVLFEIAKVLELDDEEFQELIDLAAIESIPDGIKPSAEILESLPVFFRTAREMKPNKETLKQLIEIIKKA